MVEYSGQTIDFPDGTLKCPAPIKEVIDIDGNDILVLLETTGKYDKYDEETRCRNVWRVGPDRSVKWKIEKADMITGEYPSFSSVWDEDGAVWAYSTNGLAYQIDLETGDLGEARQLK